MPRSRRRSRARDAFLAVATALVETGGLVADNAAEGLAGKLKY